MLNEFEQAVYDRLSSVSWDGTVNVYSEVPRGMSFPYCTWSAEKNDTLPTDSKTLYDVRLRCEVAYKYAVGEVHTEELQANVEKAEDALKQPLNVSGHSISDVHTIQNTFIQTQQEDSSVYKTAITVFSYDVVDEVDDSTYVYNSPQATYLYGSENGYQFDKSGGNPSITYNSSIGEWEVDDGNVTFLLNDTLTTSTGVPGSDNELLFNDGGVLGTDANLTYDGTNLTVEGTTVIRQPGGTAGTDEVHIYAEGNHGYVESKTSNNLKLQSSQDVVFDVPRSMRGKGQPSLGIDVARWGDIYGIGTLDIKASSGQTDPLLDLQDSSASKLFDVSTGGEPEVHVDGNGLILTSPDGSVRKRIYLANDGTVSTETV